MSPPVLVIDADDYGYAPAYDAGIADAALAGAIDGAALMVARGPDPEPLIEAGIALGLHLEPGPPPRAQADAFEHLVGRPPAYIDGHHHWHANPAVAGAVAELAIDLGAAVRSVGEPDRARLRGLGIATADRLIGRLSESEPPLPAELERWIDAGVELAGMTEWMVHPGRPDPSTGSSYDAGRGEDLRLLLELGDRAAWAARGIRRSSLGRAPTA